MKPLKIYLSFLLLLIAMLGARPLLANTIRGGELDYEQVGKDSFKVSLAVYRDCNGIRLGNTVSIRVTSACGTFMHSLSSSGQPIEITPVCPNQCTRCSSPGCSFKYGYQRYEYTGLLVLKNMTNACNKVDLSFSVCCRGTSSLAGANQGYYTSTSFMRNLNGQNSSPRFKEDFQFILCKDRDQRLSFGATDGDLDTKGRPLDSLVYELANPKTGPSSNATWSSGYGLAKPVSFLGFPKSTDKLPKGFHFDATTGSVAFRPDKFENTYLAVKVSEYRNGVKIGEKTRDLGVEVILCPQNSNPGINGPECSMASMPATLTLCHNSDSVFNFCSVDAQGKDSVELQGSTNAVGAALSKTGNAKRRGLKLTWNPSNSLAGGQAFALHLSAKDDACPVPGYAAYAIKLQVEESDWDFEVSSSQVADCGQLSAWIDNKSKTIGIKQIKWMDETGKVLSNSDTLKLQADTMPFEKPVKIVLYNDNGCRRTVYDTLKISSFKGPYLPVAADIFQCYSNQDSIEAWEVGGSGNSYSWQFISQGPAKSYSTKKIKLPAGEDGRLTLKVRDAQGCEVTQTVKVRASKKILPEEQLVDESFCATKVRIDLLDDSRGYTDMWTGPKVSNGEFALSESDTGTFTLAYTLVDKSHPQCSSTFNKIIRARPKQPLYLGTDTILCSRSGLLHQFDFPMLPSKTSLWGDDLSFDRNTNRYYLAKRSLSNTGTYQYRVQGTDSLDCYEAATLSIRTKRLALPKFNQSIGSGKPPLAVRFFNQTPNQINTAFQWGFGDGATSSTVSPQHTYAKGVYDVSLKVMDTVSGCSDSVTSKAAVVASVPATASFSATPLIGNAPLKVSFVNSSVADTVDIVYEWRVNDSLFSTAEAPEITLPIGLYSFSLSVRDTLTGVVDSSVRKDYVLVKKLFVGLNGRQQLEVKVYPNPASDRFIIEMAQAEQPVLLNLYNSDGRLVQSQPILKASTEVDASGLPGGLYSYRLLWPDGRLVQGRLLLE